MQLIADFLGHGQAGAKPRTAKRAIPAVEEDETEEDPEAALKRKRQRAFELWTEAQAIPGTLGQVYFEQHRGIVVDWAAVHSAVRFHPKLWCSEREGHLPAILFRVSASHDGETLTVHRLYLGDDGDKAKIKKPKKAYSDYKGGGVWFGKPIEGGNLREGGGAGKRARLLHGRPPLRRFRHRRRQSEEYRAALDRQSGPDRRRSRPRRRRQEGRRGLRRGCGARRQKKRLRRRPDLSAGPPQRERKMGGLERPVKERRPRRRSRAPRSKRAVGRFAARLSLARGRRRHRVPGARGEGQARRHGGGRSLGLAVLARRIHGHNAEPGQQGLGPLAENQDAKRHLAQGRYTEDRTRHLVRGHLQAPRLSRP